MYLNSLEQVWVVINFIMRVNSGYFTLKIYIIFSQYSAEDTLIIF